MHIERNGLTGSIVIHPEDGQHSATVVIMHGLGDSSEGFSDVAQMLSSSMPHVKFILPTASSRPVSLNGGIPMNAWYDIVGKPRYRTRRSNYVR
jgi:predicted esterase